MLDVLPRGLDRYAVRLAALASAGWLATVSGGCIRPASPTALTPVLAPRIQTRLVGRTPPAEEPRWSPAASPQKPSPAASPQKPSPADPREAVIRAAQRYLEGAPLRAGGYDFEPDPVGFVRAAYWSANVELFASEPPAKQSGMAHLYASAGERSELHAATPHPGDLIFFKTPTGNEPAGVAVVEEVAADGTVVAIGSFANGPERIRVNLLHPAARTDAAGTPINDLLAGQPAAQLFLSFASPL